jgi:hypothetical protein
MNANTKTHVLKLPEQTLELRITELSEFIWMEVYFERAGDFGNDVHLEKWFSRIVGQYDSDPRRMCMVSINKSDGTTKVTSDYGNAN